MKSRAVLGLMLLLALAWTPASAQRRPPAPVPQLPAADSPIHVRTWLSQSAAWLGDPVVYTVELRSALSFDVLGDDLNSDRIRVDGGDLLGSEHVSEEQGEQRVHRLRYTIAAYRVDTTELRVRPITVRYYTRFGNVVAEGAPAGEVTVPAAIIPVRSTLSAQGEMPSVRQPPALRPAPLGVRIAWTLGLLLIAISIVPIALVTFDVAGRARRAWTGRTARRARRQQRLTLEQLTGAEPTSDSARIEAFTELDRLVRDRLVLAGLVNAHALTASEVRESLEQRRSALPHDQVAMLLTACETARYAPDPPAAAEWDSALEAAQQVLTATRQ